MLDTHGLPMNGLGKAVEHINNWPKYDSRGYTQVDYNPKTGDVYIEDHVASSLGEAYCNYKDRAVIRIGFFANAMTLQKLADAIFCKVNENKQEGSGVKEQKKINPRHAITLSNGEKVDTYGIPMRNLEKALKEINSWGRLKGVTQIDYSIVAGTILYRTLVYETAYVRRESQNVISLGCITGCTTAQNLADIVRDAVNERKKKEEQKTDAH